MNLHAIFVIIAVYFAVLRKDGTRLFMFKTRCREIQIAHLYWVIYFWVAFTHLHTERKSFLRLFTVRFVIASSYRDQRVLHFDTNIYKISKCEHISFFQRTAVLRLHIIDWSLGKPAGDIYYLSPRWYATDLLISPSQYHVLGASALHLAIAYHNNDLATILVKCGANINQRAIGEGDQKHGVISWIWQPYLTNYR